MLVDRESKEFKNQSVAILRFLCEEFVLTPMRSWGRYELDWYFETKADADGKPGAYDAIYNADTNQDQINFTVECFTAFLERLDVRWADGREHIAGRDVTAADFNLIAFYTSIVTNPGLYSPEIGE